MGSAKQFFFGGFYGLKPLVICLVAACLLPFPPVSMAGAFAVSTLGNYGDITVMEVTGDYDELTAQGKTNDGPRQLISKAFLEKHPDRYDFLVIFSNFDFAMDSDTVAFYLGVKNDTRGIGLDLFDHSAFFGSKGVLQGVIDMGNLENLSSDPLDPRFSSTMGILSHEMLHRWAAHVRFREEDGSISTRLLGKDGAHWSFLLDTMGSVLYGNRWQDNGDGTFTSLPGRKYYSPLDLYLMGLIGRSEVPPMLLIDHAETDPAALTKSGVTIAGAASRISIEDIISAEGERIPDAAASQKSFNVACIFITRPGTFSGDELFRLRTIMRNWELWFSSLTDGRAAIRMDAVPAAAVPQNPGVDIPPVDPGSVPAGIHDGVAWLVENQASDGRWADAPRTAERDTAEALTALVHFSQAAESCSAGKAWLSKAASAGTDFVSRRISALSASGKETDAWVREVVSRQNVDGGWGSGKGYTSNAVDTALVLKAFAAAGHSDAAVIDAAAFFLKAQQHPDGGWGTDDGESRMMTTTNLLQAFLGRHDVLPDEQMRNGWSWLTARQNPDGGFGTCPGTVYDTAAALIALKSLGTASPATDAALGYLLNHQSGNGSWHDSAWQTAMAVAAILKTSIAPDLQIGPADISFEPDRVASLPADIAIRATVHNSGMTDVPSAGVVLYRNAVSEENRLSEQTIAVPGKSVGTATFTTNIQDGGHQRYCIVVDPEDLVSESFETNNTAIKTLYPETTHDFEILAAGLSTSPADAGFNDPLTITARVRNGGASDAFDVRLTYAVAVDGEVFDILTTAIDAPAGKTVAHTFEWIANLPQLNGAQDVRLIARVDPLGHFSEISEENNAASAALDITVPMDPNLVVTHPDITIDPDPAHEKGRATVTARIRNAGFSAAENVVAAFSQGMPGSPGALLGTRTVAGIAAGENQTITFEWEGIPVAGETLITVHVDPENAIPEIIETDNQAFKTLNVLSLPDLAVSAGSVSIDPAAPREGETVSFRIRIQNMGGQGASDVGITVHDGEHQIHAATVPVIDGRAVAETSFSWAVPAQNGPHILMVSVDPDNRIAEQDETNNVASKSLGVQDADLWLTETYISPNGDGVKDATQFFFRLDRAESVEVAVVGEKGETVRTFSDAAFENTTGGSVTWDGLRDNGTVAADGPYWIRVMGGDKTALAGLPVVLDNNRSTLGQAVRKRAILQRNLSCLLPDIAEKVWLPDESALIFSIPETDDNASGYPNGIYAATPDGGEIRRLVPWEWSVGVDAADDVRYTRFSVSPDAAHIAFALTRFNKTTLRNDGEELWCAGVDGTRRVSLLRFDFQEMDARIRGLVWSPDGERLAVKIYDNRMGREMLRIVARDGTESTSVDPASLGKGKIVDASLGWSPDSSRLSFAIADGGQGKICLADAEGRTVVLSDYNGGYRRLEWLNNMKLLLLTANFGKTSCWILDASGTGLHQEITDFNAAEAAIHPKTDTFAFIQNGLSVMVCDAEGRCGTVHEADTFIDDLRWSSDGRRLAFFSEKHREIHPCLFESAFVVVTPENKDVQALAVGYFIEAADTDIYGGPYDRCGMKFADYEATYRENRFYYRYGSLTWLGDEHSLLAEEENRGVFAIGTGDHDGPVYLPIEKGSGVQVSPHGRTIAYEGSVDPESICAESGPGEDTWTMSSLLNLTADLAVLKRGSGLSLRGVAVDLNFESYLLEWADAAAPDRWQNIMPSAEIPVVDDLFTSWVPPHEGTFLVRLTVTDLAGNRKQDWKRVSWGLYSSITNLSKVGDLFSPNGDGVKDSVELHYRVLEPSHLEFYVFDEADRLIRTFYKDHAVPPGKSLDDHIVWDGRDDLGRPVADGIYRIRVADFEFFFEVDTTPPDVELRLGRIMGSIEQGESVDLNDMVVEMTGRVLDDNLQKWTIEYGQGDNPEHWYEYTSGKDAFLETSPSGEMSPIVEFCRNEKACRDAIPFLTGRKFRITALDFAGNRRTVVTDYADEVLFLAAWHVPESLREHYNNEGQYLIRASGQVDGNQFCEGEMSDRSNRIPPELAASGQQTLYAFQTLRQPIASLMVQYGTLKDPVDAGADLLENIDWFDSPEMRDPPSSRELIEIVWNNRDLGTDATVIAVRLRAISISGETHDSLPVIVADLFSIATCAKMQWTKLPPGSPEPSEDLDGYCENIPPIPSRQKTLTFSWKKTDEGDGAWREYLAYDAEAGDVLPVGIFPIPRPPEEILPAVFDIRMSSELLSEDGDLEKCTLVTTIDCDDPTIIVEYPKANACGTASPNLADVSGGLPSISTPMRVANFGFDPEVLKAVSLYLLHEDTPRLLQRLDLANRRADTLTIDTRSLEEGKHPVKMVYDIVSGGAAYQEEAMGEIIADRTAPEARITFPTEASRFCPQWVSEEEGGWYAIDVEGSVTDNIQIQRYELWYGVGPDPEIWKPAITRVPSYISVGDPPYYNLTRRTDTRRGSARIIGEGRREGLLGRWDVTGFGGGETYALMLKVVDATGNVSCHTTTFTMDQQVHLDVSCGTRLFSPNSDGLFDTVEITWETNEYTAVDVRVVQGARTVKTLVSGAPHYGGAGSAAWDGTDDAGAGVPDGIYTFKVSAVDACGNTVERTISGIAVDITPPLLEISYPRPGEVIGTVVEVEGTAADPHFSSYRLVEEESGQIIGAASRPCIGSVLGRWNTSGKEGPRTLVLSASDTVGNTALIRATVDIASRSDLITRLSADPAVISPNGDGRLDSAEIRYATGEACDVRLEILAGGTVVHRLMEGVPPGEHGVVWDGRKDGHAVPDGTLRVVLTATLVSDAAVMQQEAVALRVDTTPPQVAVTYPEDQAFLRDDALSIRGGITDLNLDAYEISVIGRGGTAIASSGTQNREGEVFAVLDTLADGTYTLVAEAMDLGENATRKTLSFTMDRTPPSAYLESPEDGGVYGGLRKSVAVSGSVGDENLKDYVIRYGRGEDPEMWTVLIAGEEPPLEAVQYAWRTDGEGGIPDGKYTVSLLATDRAGWTAESRATIMVDNTPPEVAITAFGENGFVRAAENVTGSISDPNLSTYRVEYAAGACDAAFKWIPVRIPEDAVESGILGTVDILPIDRDYCLRVTASDKAGNTGWKTREFTVDTRPPLPPVLAGLLATKTDAVLTWPPNAEPDIAGYILYRDRRTRHPEALLTDGHFADAGLGEGVYLYTLTAVDHAGWESEPSKPVRIHVDLTPPSARIGSPRSGAAVGGIVDIKGTASSVDDFKAYRLYFGEGKAGSDWRLVRTSPVPVAYDSLFQWDTLGLAEVEYGFRLEAEDTAGNIGSHEISVRIDNTPPKAPVLMSATPTGTDVDLVWQADSEADLAGYLIYRNDRLANVDGTVIGDLSPYLVGGTVYRDAGLADGAYVYYLIAMDGSGNMSDPSNPITCEIDTRPPRAHIATPADGARFQNLLTLQAASEDLDIATLRFQYRPVSDAVWTDIGDPQGTSAFIARLDPAGAGLDFGDYRLRALATDRGGRTDPSPSEITVIYTDLAPPEPPENLAAVVTEGDVALDWTAGTAPDIAGYHVYRADRDKDIRVNAALLAEAGLTLKALADGIYLFKVTAVDGYGNESAPSRQVRAVVFTPWLEQPYTPTDQDRIHIGGGGVPAENNPVAELFLETEGDQVAVETAPCGPDGTFAVEPVLLPGENHLTAVAHDVPGNRSRPSERVVVVYNEAPAAPTAVAASPDGDGCLLTWHPHPEPDVVGYHLYRNGEKMNAATPVTVGTASASNTSGAKSAFDGKDASYWQSGEGPAWWQISWASPRMISRIEIAWLEEYGVLYAGRDYDIQVWSGYNWISRVKVDGNQDRINGFDLSPAYVTDRIRIVVTASTAASWRFVGISEVRVREENPIQTVAVEDLAVPDGDHEYRVTAVDRYGFESPLSDPVRAVVGDIAAPGSPLDLLAEAVGSDVSLSWTETPDAAAYQVYRRTEAGWTNLARVTGAVYLDSGLVNGTHAYQVTAVDAAGNESLPSNEALTTVYLSPPHAPLYPDITIVPEGGALHICWQAPPEAPAGYRLYRSDSPDSGYAPVFESPITDTCYRDEPVPNDIPCYYRVVSVDAVGNESDFSETIAAVAHDSVPPPAPVLFSPTIPGRPISVPTDIVGISGWAEPSADVRLFEGGVRRGAARASAEDDMEGIPVDETSIHMIALSPDSRSVAMVTGNMSPLTVIKDLETGTITRVTSGSGKPVWSPDSRKIAYTIHDDQWKQRIEIFDRDTRARSRLTGDFEVNEWDPSWSADSSKIVCASDRSGRKEIWIVDPASGAKIQVTNGADDPGLPYFSTDGAKIAYLTGESPASLLVVDAQGGDPAQVGNGLTRSGDGREIFSWSPTGGAVGFVSLTGIGPRVVVWDAESRTTAEISVSADAIQGFRWSPDGRRMVCAIRNDTETEIWTVPVDDAADAAMLTRLKTSAVSELDWTPSGHIHFWNSEDHVCHVVLPAGFFHIPGVRLHSGENEFYAVAADDTGNPGDSSEAVSIRYASAPLPDPAVQALDLAVNPPAPIAGETAVVSAVIRNPGQAAVRNTDVKVYIWSAQGGAELVHAETLPSIAPGAVGVIRFDWDSTGRAGLNSIIVTLDSEDKVREASEANNLAVIDFHVAVEEGVSLSILTASDRYEVHENVVFEITLFNSGPPVEGKLETWIEDENGIRVESLGDLPAALHYGSMTAAEPEWNTGDTLAGHYRVHAVFTSGGEVLAAATAPLIILPDLRISATVTTDRAAYPANGEVRADLRMDTRGENSVVPPLTVEFSIASSDGATLFRDTRQVNGTIPGGSVSFTWNWNTALNPAGTYSAAASILMADEQVASARKTFQIDGGAAFRGTLTASPQEVPAAGTTKLQYTVTNIGNQPVGGLPLTISLADPETLETQWEETVLADIGIAETATGEIFFSTEGLALKPFRASLKYRDDQGKYRTLSTAVVTVKDLSGPEITVISPAADAVLTCAVDLSLTVRDNASGIRAVEYRVDDGSWIVMAAADPASGRYASSWMPPGPDAGSYRLQFRAFDTAGNAGLSKALTLTAAPAAENATGEIQVAPETILSGSRIRGVFSVTNPCNRIIGDLPIRISIANAGTAKVLQTLERMVFLPGRDAVGDPWEVSVPDMPPGNYRAILQAVFDGNAEPKTLSAAEFEVRPAVEADKTVASPVNLLVWINDGCHPGGGGHRSEGGCDCGGKGQAPSAGACRDCIRTDLLTPILDEITDSRHIVHDRPDMETELRNPLYTDILILGDQHPLKGHFGDELAEKVFSGTGLISSLWLAHGDGTPMDLGVRFRGRLSDLNPVVYILENFAGGSGELNIVGPAYRIDREGGAEVVGQFITDGKLRGKRAPGMGSAPAIVADACGMGKTVYFAFDLGRSLNEETAGQIKDILASCLGRVHQTETPQVFHPGMMIPVRLSLTNPGPSVDIRVTETFPAGFEVFDPEAGAWYSESPWAAEIGLSSGEIRDIVYYLRTPAVPGPYMAETEIRIESGDGSWVVDRLGIDMLVAKDWPEGIQDAIRSVKALTASRKDQSRIASIVKHLEKVQAREIRDRQGIAMNIHDLLTAVHALISVKSVDITQVRLELDLLLGMMESGYYFHDSVDDEAALLVLYGSVR